MANPEQRPSRNLKDLKQAPLSMLIDGRQPPNARSLEETLLGALMLDKDLAIDIQDFVKAEHFYEPQHAAIFSTISALVQEKVAVDIFTVSQKLRELNKLEEVGGQSRILELSAKVASSAHAHDHAKKVIQMFLRRELISRSSVIQKDAYDYELDVEDLMEKAEASIFELHESSMRKEIRPVEVVVRETLDWLEEISKNEEGCSGIPSGFPVLDEITGGWQKSDLVILAARPSMGKTAFALTMARNMVMEHKQSVAFFSLEMSNLQLMLRLLTAETGIDSKMLRAGRLGPDEWNRLVQHGGALSESHFYLDDTQGLGIGELRSKCRKLKSKYNVGLIIVDYLQLITAPSLRNGNREQEVSMISRGLKGIAKELNVSIIALAQLSRALESRSKGDKRPILSDLRESGSIEQDADLVLFIHRPERLGVTEFPDMSSTAGKAEIVIAKHRNGDTGSIFLDFIGEQTKFVDNGDRVDHNAKPGSDQYLSALPTQQVFDSKSDEGLMEGNSMPGITSNPSDIPF